jgi:hypothetical protein
MVKPKDYEAGIGCFTTKELVIVALMQNELFISYNILWQEQVTFDGDDCVRFVIDQHTKLNFYSAEATVHRKTCRSTQDMLS